jgi:hypothetical protein
MVRGCDREKSPFKQRSRLEPLLARVQEKRTAILCPIIEEISSHNLAYFYGSAESIGVFTWSLHFSWAGIFPRLRPQLKSRIDSIP